MTKTIELRSVFAYNTVMARRYLFLGLLILAIIGGATWQTTQAQGGEEYFDQTGHVVTGEFLAAYRSVPNPVQLFGYPITDAFQDTTRNLLVQYFQKTRFELDPAGPVGNRVMISPLGEYLYTPGPESQMIVNPGACRTYSPDDIRVCYAFLDFYDRYGGQKQFGLPISNAEKHDGRTVQYFQNARFEYHPELPAGQKIVLTDLGRQYFDRRAEDRTLLLPNRSDNTANTIRSLRVRAYPERAVTGKTGSQTVYITVQDQRLLPVANAQVILDVQLPDKQQKRFIVPASTNNAGITQFTFPFNAKEVGMATIQVFALRGDLEAGTTASFRIWY
jgi:hypothetical protein